MNFKNKLFCTFLMFASGMYAQIIENVESINLSLKPTSSTNLLSRPNQSLKINQGNLHSLDSLEYYTIDNGNYTKLIAVKYFYDANNNHIESIIPLTERETYEYDNNNNYVKYTYFGWDSSLENWKPKYEILNTYDGNNQLTLQIFNKHDNFKILPINKYEHQYDLKGNKIVSNSYEFDTAVKNWKLTQINKYFYNNNGELITENILNSNSEITEINTLTYDANGNNLVFFKQKFDTTNNIFIDESKIENTYNNLGKLVTSINFRRDFNSDLLVYNYKTENVVKNDSLISTTFDYDNLNNAWKYSERNINVFDNRYVYDELILPNQYKKGQGSLMNFDYLLKDYYQGDFSTTSNQFNFIKFKLYYSNYELVNSNYELNVEKLEVFPNPAYNILNFNLQENNSGELSLMNLQGNEVLNSTITNHTPISIENLESGMYIYSVKMNGITTEGKIIKE